MIDRSMEVKYYLGSDTPVTSALYVLECENGHKDWYLMPHTECFRCKGKIIKGNPPSYKREADA